MPTPLYTLLQSSGKEKCIALGIPPHALGVIPGRIKLLPHAGGEDVFVAFVPSPVDDLGEVGVLVCAFQGRIRGGCDAVVVLLRMLRTCQWIVGGRVRRDGA